MVLECETTGIVVLVGDGIVAVLASQTFVDVVSLWVFGDHHSVTVREHLLAIIITFHRSWERNVLAHYPFFLGVPSRQGRSGSWLPAILTFLTLILGHVVLTRLCVSGCVPQAMKIG